MNQILFRPTDVLFFRDGRPMSGSLAGHTAAWPLPDVTNHALHAALHRAEFDGVHLHRRGRSGIYSDERNRLFGSLKTAGPFPVRTVESNGKQPERTWFFPRPKDAQKSSAVIPTLHPVRSLNKDGDDDPWIHSSLPDPLEYAVANSLPPSKDTGGEPWISQRAFEAYLRDDEVFHGSDHDFLKDEQLADREHQIGIGIDPDTQTQDKTNFYSAHYLRLREGYQLGLYAEARDKEFAAEGGDLIKALLNGKPEQIVVGGQQRICTAARADAVGALHLPTGLHEKEAFRHLDNDKFAVKWVLLSPAVWPAIAEGTSKRGTERRGHAGGWLPNWICPESGDVLLEAVSADERKRRRSLNGGGKGYESNPSRSGRLVAAIIPKPITVTGWALPTGTREESGAKSTHLAVPAGAVYYFEANSAEDAAALAGLLNWHGNEPAGASIKNRRSTLLGEKGYGLGVCGTWKFYAGGGE